MATLLTVGKVICNKEERTIQNLSRIFVRLSGIQVFLGILTIGLWYFFPEMYGVWYYLLQGIICFPLGVLGIVAGIRYSKRLTILFGILLTIRYIYYFVVEYLLFSRGTNLQFELPIWWALPLALIKLFYGVLIFYFLILFYRELKLVPDEFFAMKDVDIVLVEKVEEQELMQPKEQEEQEEPQLNLTESTIPIPQSKYTIQPKKKPTMKELMSRSYHLK